MAGVVTHLRRMKHGCWNTLSARFTQWTKPLLTSLPLQTMADLGRSKSELIAENALLRKPLIILKRQVKRPSITRTDCMLLVLLARLVRTWQQAQITRATRHEARGGIGSSFACIGSKDQRPLPTSRKSLRKRSRFLRQMAKDNRLWGAERIRGELLKLGLRVCKRTIQKYLRNVRTQQPRGQTWSTFLQTRAQQIWACDFLPVTDLFFRSLFAFFTTLLHSRKVIHVGVTRSPTDAWTAHQLREATAFGVGPKYLIRDNESKFGVSFARVAKTSGIELLKTPNHAPRANAICERFLGSVRRECLDHLLILHERQLQRVLNAYLHYFNQARPQEADPAADP